MKEGFIMKRKLLLTSIVIALSVLLFGAVGACALTYNDFTYTVTNKEVTITSYDGNDEVVEIPDEIGNYPVVAIGEEAFERCDTITEIVLPYGLISIGEEAFRSCDALASINIPSTVTSIGSYAFSFCSELTSVKTTNLEAWCNISFANANANPLRNDNAILYLGSNSVTELVIPSTVTKINDFAFSGYENLQKVEIPYGVKSIGADSFFGCYSLTSVTIPSSITSVGEEAFQGCHNLEKVCITDLKAWCNISFADANANPLYNSCSLYINDTLVDYLTIPEGIIEIKDYAFSGCSGLTGLTIAESVISIGASSFSSCGGIKYITIPANVTSRLSTSA